MAGSYRHVIEADGSLSSNKRVAGMLENGGDVFEAVEEMYGMIWWLAHIYASEDRFDPIIYDSMRDHVIEEARQNYKEGLKLSPTRRYQ